MNKNAGFYNINTFMCWYFNVKCYPMSIVIYSNVPMETVYQWQGPPRSRPDLALNDIHITWITRYGFNKLSANATQLRQYLFIFFFRWPNLLFDELAKEAKLDSKCRSQKIEKKTKKNGEQKKKIKNRKPSE